MEKKTIRSGAPFLAAGCAVLLTALVWGLGSLFSYVIAAAMGAAGFMAGKKAFPDRVIEVERAPQSGDRQVDELIAEARTQLVRIEQANDVIGEPELSAQIDDIAKTCRQILARLEEQPQMLSSLRTFLRYYLPATLSLLESRSKLESEVNAGESQAIAGRIRGAMAQVQAAFHQQLDALDEFRFINLESEMDVLADMLRSDGLTGSDKKETADGEEKDDLFSGMFAEKR